MTTALLDPDSDYAEDAELLTQRRERLADAADAGYVDERPPGLPDDAETSDPAAPYGRKLDGTPYKVSSARRAQLLNNRHRSTGGSYKAPGKTSGAKKGSAARSGPDFRPALHGLLAIPQMALGVLAGRNRAFGLDALTLHKFSGPLVDAVQDAAEQDERLAAALERLNSVGPYGALVGVAVALGTQLAANHGKLPAGQFGTSTADELLAEAEKLAA